MDNTNGLIKEVCNAVVKINTANGSGSGFYLKDKGIVITNHHVVSGHLNVCIETQNKDKFTAKVVFVNPTLDLAFLLPSEKLELPVINLHAIETFQNMEKVSVLGFPFGMPFTITEGIISSVSQLLDGKKYIQTDAAVNPGNSGGPLVNKQGEVIGITTCKFKEADNVGFALPVKELIGELESFAENKEMVYSIKCASCSHLIYEKTEYCPNCGQEIDVNLLFTDRELTPLAQFVEPGLKELGIDPIIARSGQDFWEFHHGSALVRVFVFKNNFLFTTSPLVKLPKINLEDIYRYVLSNPVEPFYFGISESQIYISNRIYLADMNSIHKEALQKNITALALKAQEIDNFLVTKFNCELSDLAKT